MEQALSIMNINKLKSIKVSNIFKQIKNKDIFIITSVIYLAIVILYELFYCNFEFITGIIQNYNLSIYRILTYCFIYFIFYKIKDQFIDEAVNALNSKVKCYFITMVFGLTILATIGLICYLCNNFSINIIMAFISILILNLFAIYISNNLIKNTIITALLFGSIFSISITFNNQLDEKRHFLSSYSVALGGFNLNSPKVDESIASIPRIMSPEQFIKYFSEKPKGEITDEFSAEALEDTPNNQVLASYFISGMGIFISKALGRKYCRYIHNRKNF